MSFSKSVLAEVIRSQLQLVYYMHSNLITAVNVTLSST